MYKASDIRFNHVLKSKREKEKYKDRDLLGWLENKVKEIQKKKEKIINVDIGMDLMIGFKKKKKKKPSISYPVNRYTKNLHKYLNKKKNNKN